MAILLKCGAIFLHIPKTGGNWIADVLEDQNLVFAHFGEKHANLTQILEFEKWFRVTSKYSKPNKPFFKFCFVRHPLTWYESWFKMQTTQGWPNWGDDSNIWHPNAMLDGLDSPDFEIFITNVLKRRPGYVTELYGWYTTPGIHFVGRYENLADDLITVLKFLNVRFDEEKLRKFKPVNVSKPADIRWAQVLQETVERTEYAAFKRFGYRTEIYLPGESERQDFIPRFSFEATQIQLERPFSKDNGWGWHVSMPQFAHLADDTSDPYRSPLVLLEDGHPSPFAHALHDDICNIGRGRFSHWKSNLYFSSTDNSDPNANGRTYRIRFQFGATDNLLTTTLGMAQ